MKKPLEPRPMPHSRMFADAPDPPLAWRSRPSLVFAIGLALILVWTGVCMAFTSDAVAACRAAIRATARASLLWFGLAYTAHAVATLWPTPTAHWLRAHRRQWGWLLLASHGVHALAIVGLGHLAPSLLTELSPPSERWGPAVAYVVLLLMGLSSFDRSAAWLGRVAWQHLHTWGSHYLWLSFMVANAKRVPEQPVYVLPVGLLGLALGLRVWARRHAGRASASSSGRV